MESLNMKKWIASYEKSLAMITDRINELKAAKKLPDISPKLRNETFNPSGADREDFAALFNGGIDAKIAAEAAARDAADQTIIRAVGEIQAELEVLDISAQFAAIYARLTALEARVTALEGGGEDA